MNKESQWYAVYTKPRWEKKVAEQLGKKGIEYYCPLNKIVRQWSDRKKTVMEPLFKSYVFVKVREQEHIAVKEIHGIVNMVYWLGKPAVIKASEIDTIRRFLNEHQNVHLEKISVNVTDRVMITSGPFMDQKGEVVGLTSSMVKVQLPSLGFALVAQVPKAHVKLITIKETAYNRKSIAI